MGAFDGLLGKRAEPPPPSAPMALLDREYEELESELGRELDVARADALLGRLDILKRRRGALMIVEQNAERDAAEREQQAKDRARREAHRQRLGLTRAQVREELAAIARAIAPLNVRLKKATADYQAFLAQARREHPELDEALLSTSGQCKVHIGTIEEIQVPRARLIFRRAELLPLLEPEDAHE